MLTQSMYTLVFAVFTQYCIQRCENSLYSGPLTPPSGKARLLMAFCLVGLAVRPQAVQGGSFVLEVFGTCQNYKGDCRQDAQPIPSS